MREWQYWTRNKLSILAGYLPAFNVASKRSPERLYIDLMAGEPFNRDKETGEEFDGSARLALSCTPPFTRIALCEMPQKAAALEKDLRTRYSGRSFRAYPGDCNETIGQVLANLGEWRWAPTFVFADQQAAEIHWETLKKISAFRDGKTKAEIWLLTSPSMVSSPRRLPIRHSARTMNRSRELRQARSNARTSSSLTSPASSSPR